MVGAIAFFNCLIVSSAVVAPIVSGLIRDATGSLSGSMIPIILKRLGLDPATASAPFVATLVDVTGLIIYFTIAALFLMGKLL